MSIHNIDHCFQQYQENKEKSLELARLIQIAAREIHAYLAAERECRDLRDAQQSCDKDGMWRVMQQHMRENQQQIRAYGPLIGVAVIPVDQASYDRMTIQDVRNQIDLLIGAIYAIRVLKTSQKAFKECLRKHMKTSGKFSKQEIEWVCRD